MKEVWMTDSAACGAFADIGALLSFAIERETEAVEFYSTMARLVEDRAICAAIEAFARQEENHVVRLKALKLSGASATAAREPVDLKIGDYLVDVKPRPDMSYQDALIIAMKREMAAEKLYSDLAAVATDQELRVLMQTLAKEERSHKLRFEKEYEEVVLAEN